MSLGMEVGLQLRRICVRWDSQLYPQRKGHTYPAKFLAHVYCGQTAKWIKMPLGTEVNLGPGDVVLDGVAALPKRGTAPSFFGSCLWPNGWMDEDATWYGSIGLGPCHILLDRVSALRESATAASLLFSAHVCCGHGHPSQLLLSSCSICSK